MVLLLFVVIEGSFSVAKKQVTQLSKTIGPLARLNDELIVHAGRN